MIEQRGITCLACSKADLQQFPEQAKCGYARCTVHEVVVFVRLAMSRNCKMYDEAPEEQVSKRQEWIDKFATEAWQR